MESATLPCLCFMRNLSYKYDGANMWQSLGNLGIAVWVCLSLAVVCSVKWRNSLLRQICTSFVSSFFANSLFLIICFDAIRMCLSGFAIRTIDRRMQCKREKCNLVRQGRLIHIYDMAFLFGCIYYYHFIIILLVCTTSETICTLYLCIVMIWL